jgi:hypothetical protein
VTDGADPEGCSASLSLSLGVCVSGGDGGSKVAALQIQFRTSLLRALLGGLRHAEACFTSG